MKFFLTSNWRKVFLATILVAQSSIEAGGNFKSLVRGLANVTSRGSFDIIKGKTQRIYEQTILAEAMKGNQTFQIDYLKAKAIFNLNKNNFRLHDYFSKNGELITMEWQDHFMNNLFPDSIFRVLHQALEKGVTTNSLCFNFSPERNDYFSDQKVCFKILENLFQARGASDEMWAKDYLVDVIFSSQYHVHTLHGQRLRLNNAFFNSLKENAQKMEQYVQARFIVYKYTKLSFYSKVYDGDFKTPFYIFERVRGGAPESSKTVSLKDYLLGNGVEQSEVIDEELEQFLVDTYPVVFQYWERPLLDICYSEERWKLIDVPTETVLLPMNYNWIYNPSWGLLNPDISKAIGRYNPEMEKRIQQKIQEKLGNR